jgi:arginine decarboxylase
MSNQDQTPLFTALLEHAKKNPIQFHIPGHKKGVGMAPEFREFIGQNALSIDLINISPLDDLHQPMGIIREAQQLAAKAFGADHTFFSVQGTSGAIMTMIMSVVGPGDKIIVPRNVHKSIMSAIIFAGAKPVFIHPTMDEQLGIAHGIPTKAVITALERHPDAKALLVINPTYFGIAANLKEIVDVCHEYDVPVLVDEAHGVHIHFHDQLPLSAMQAGADMAATSVHKLGGSMTQSSILNIKGDRVNPHRVQTVISMLTTTSTSYLLLASLDVARRHLVMNGKYLAEHSIELAQYARNELNNIPGLYCVGKEILGTEATYDYDPTKLIIHINELGMTGSDVEKWLRTERNIEVEMSDLYNVLCIVTPGDTRDSIQALIDAFKALSEQQSNKKAVEKVEIKLPEIPLLAYSPREAFYAETVTIPLREAADRIIAEFIYVYPPGIPILLPGEVISEENISYIQAHLNVGLPVQGPEDKTLQNIKVIVETRPIT